MKRTASGTPFWERAGDKPRRGGAAPDRMRCQATGPSRRRSRGGGDRRGQAAVSRAAARFEPRGSGYGRSGERSAPLSDRTRRVKDQAAYFFFELLFVHTIPTRLAGREGRTASSGGDWLGFGAGKDVAPAPRRTSRFHPGRIA